MSLAFSNDLIGTILYVEEGEYKILSYLDYDSMTHQFLLEVQNLENLQVTNSEFSDKIRYEVDLPKKGKPNSKRLRPKKITT